MKFKINGKGLIYGYDKRQHDLIIPKEIDGITVNGFSVSFKQNLNIKSVFIPNTMKEFQTSQFYRCYNIKSFVFEEKSKLKKIPASCFGYAFADDTTISLPDSIQTIGTCAFEDSKLKGITLGENLESIARDAFDNSKIKYADFSKCEKLSTIDAFSFCSCRNLEFFDLSRSKITLIPHGCFSDCENLKSIKLPNGITSFGSASFYRCSKLENIDCNWSEVEEVKNECFYQTNLKTLDLTDFCGKIYTGAFKRSKIKTLILGDYISFIGEDAFKGNPFMENKESLEVSIFCVTAKKGK